MPTCCVTASHFHSKEQEYYGILTSAGFEVRFVDPDVFDLSQAPILIDQLDDCQAVLCSTEPYTAEVLAKSKLRVVSRAGVGFDSVDLNGATLANIVVTRTPGVLHESAAEHTLATIFAIYRNVVQRDKDVRAGKWDRVCWPRLKGKTLGILGLGIIGACVAEKGMALGMNVIAHDPVASEIERVGRVSLDELWANSDIISLHAPCVPATEKIINRQTIAKMKRSAVLINTSRGGLVNEADLFDALQEKRILAAGLDVFQQEPPAADNPLFSLPNILLSPHMAGMDLDSERDMASLAAQNIVDLYCGKFPRNNIVNQDVVADWKW